MPKKKTKKKKSNGSVGGKLTFTHMKKVKEIKVY